MWLWALLPVSLAVFGATGIWAVFAISITNGSVNLTEEFPLISYCGTFNPQSCLFSQVCNTCSVLALWVVVIRFQQVRDFGNHGKANVTSFVLGFLSCIGISILGNFQQSVLGEIHTAGALMCFFMGLGFFWLQLFLTFRTQPQDRCWVWPVRAALCFLSTAAIVTMMALQFTNHYSGAAVCEWIFVMLLFCLFGLFAAEFRHVDFHRLTVQKVALENNCTLASVETNEHAIS